MTKTNEAKRILLVDDDPVFVGRAREALDAISVIRTVASGSDAISTALLWKPDVILFDLLMNEVDGFTFLEVLSGAAIDPQPFILCTTDGRGAGTRVRPLPGWQVGTLLRSSSTHQIRMAVLQAVRSQDPVADRRSLA